MPPKVSEAHVEARRGQIMEAAMACFSRQGFHHTTMDDICREAVLSPGAVYRYFSGKNAIIESCCGMSQQQTLAVFESALQKDDTQEALAELSQVFFGMLDQPEAASMLRFTVELWAEALRSPEVAQVLKAGAGGVRQRCAALIRRAQEKGEVNPELGPDAVARTMISIYEGMVLQKASDPSMDVWAYVKAVKALYGGTFWHA